MNKKLEILQIIRAEKIESMEELKKKGYDIKKISKNDKGFLMQVRSILKYNSIKAAENLQID